MMAYPISLSLTGLVAIAIWEALSWARNAFVPRLNRKREPVHFPPAAFRSAPRPDDLTMDHADTTPCEYVPPFDPSRHGLKNG
jgi:hypothetical protein